MPQDQYWLQLRVQFNSLANQAGGSLGGWCDWFEPRNYCPGSSPPCVLGRVGFVSGRHSREWRFRLLLDCQYSSVDEIQWDRQLPATDTDWFQIDDFAGTIEIEPRVPHSSRSGRIAAQQAPGANEPRGTPR